MARDAIHAAVQEALAQRDEPAQTLTRWALIVESADGQETRSLYVLDSDASGARLVRWERNGMLFDTLFSGKENGR